MSSLVTARGARPKNNALDKYHSSEETHHKAMEAVRVLKFEKLKTLSYSPRSKEAWASHFFFIANPNMMNQLIHQC